MAKRGRKPNIDFGAIKRGHFITAPMDQQASVRNSASLWGRTYGGRISVRINTSATGYRTLRIYRVR